LPEVRGLNRYSPAQLEAILAPCRTLKDPAQHLQACAAALSGRLVLDGYVNSRVFVRAEPPPGALEVVEGRVVELRVTGDDGLLNQRVARLLQPLRGEVLHLPSIEQQLQLLKRQPGVGTVRGNLSRLGSDPTLAVFSVSVDPAPRRWQGELSLRNDGSSGSGEGRAVGTLIKADLASRGDVLLLYGELNSPTDQASLGALISSVSYTYPISSQLFLTGAFGYSRRNLVELPAPANDLSTSQYQGLAQLEWVFKETLNQRWSAFLGYSSNGSNTFLEGRTLNAAFVPESVRSPRSGYLRVGVAGSGFAGRVGWGGNAYLLQGVAASTPSVQREELASVGINPGSASALGGLISAVWSVAPAWQLNLRAGGQVAFQPLTSPMQFTLGSDVGLRGLPGQLISGDSGWIGTAEVSWTFWQKGNQALQLVPFFGAGGVSTSLGSARFSDTVGSGGVLARWLKGNQWAIELGWVEQFETDNNLGEWNDWLLGRGLYGKVSFRF
jgi:hemolysin activation/secretion protein